MAEEKISAGRWLARVDEYERWIARDNDGPEWLLIYRNSRDFCAQKALEAEAKERAEKAVEVSRGDVDAMVTRFEQEALTGIPSPRDIRSALVHAALLRWFRDEKFGGS